MTKTEMKENFSVKFNICAQIPVQPTYLNKFQYNLPKQLTGLCRPIGIHKHRTSLETAGAGALHRSLTS